MFKTLTDASFASCATDTTPSECEDLIPTTTPTMVYPADPRLELEVADRTQSSVTVEWTVSAELDVVNQVVTLQRLDSNIKADQRLVATQRRHIFTDLYQNTTYKVCVELTVSVGNGTTDVEPCLLYTSPSPRDS